MCTSLVKSALFVALADATAIRRADHYHSVDVTAFKRNTTSSEFDELDRRTKPVTWCLASESKASVCIALGGFVTTTAISIASLIMSSAAASSCAPTSGSGNGAQWTVHASGNGCTIDASASTYSGALENFFDAADGEVCGIHCLELTYGDSGYSFFYGFRTYRPEYGPFLWARCADQYLRHLSERIPAPHGRGR